MQWVHTVEYSSALQRKDILTQAATWLNFEDIMGSDINQTHRDKYCMVPCIAVKFIETKNRMRVSRDKGRGHGKCCLMGTVSVWDDEHVLEVNDGDGCAMM